MTKTCNHKAVPGSRYYHFGETYLKWCSCGTLIEGSPFIKNGSTPGGIGRRTFKPRDETTEAILEGGNP